MPVTGHTPEDPTSSAASTSPRISIRDVARDAGVSHQTVSRVINDHPYVSAAARERVRAAITRLRYQPSRTARALARGVSNSVTVLTSNTHLYGYSQTLAGIEEAARLHGAQVGIKVLSADTGAAFEAALTEVSDEGAGVIVLAFDRIGASALATLPSQVPTAAAAESSLGRSTQPPTSNHWAWFDDVTCSAAATDYLLDMGHEVVHHLAIPSSGAVSDRTRGWSNALTARGLDTPAVSKPAGWGIEAAYDAGLALLADPNVSAVLCGNDDQAIGLMRAAGELGIDIPSQLSVVGFDDVPHAAFLTPALTTVRFDFVELGRRVFALLHEADHDASPPRPLPAPRLVVRESAAPPRPRTARTRPTSPADPAVGTLKGQART